MTLREYNRILDHVNAFRQRDDLFFAELSAATHDKIWKVVAEGASRPADFKEFMSEATKAKQRLLQYVLDSGPFLFEDGRCLMIDVRQFNANDWQWPQIPVIDVTDHAQRAFLSPRKLSPEKYFRERIPLIMFMLGVIAAYFLVQCVASR
jgi:hypothetical protein